MSEGESMAGLTRAQIDKVEFKDFAMGPGPLRPRDAATLILLDRSQAEPHVLMGRRSSKHAFMPGRLVFPGGRTDPDDGRVKVASDLHPDIAARLNAGRGRPLSATRARAIVLSAVRETYEEAGLLIGNKGDYSTAKASWEAFAEHGVVPDLASLRIIARAITPPGRVRRFDTYFVAAWRDQVAVSLPEGGPTQELEELVWLPIARAMEQEVPAITRSVLGDLARRLADDPDLTPAHPIPFYRMRYGKFHRDLI